MTERLLGKYSFSIAPRDYWNLILPVSDAEGFYIFDIKVEQRGQVLFYCLWPAMEKC
jgi:hypothetical protein